MKNLLSLFEKVQVVCAVAGGLLVSAFGEFTTAMRVLVIFVIIDIITGLIKGWFNKNLSSEKMAKGMIKKAFEFLIIAMAYQLDRVVDIGLVLKDITVMFYLVEEGMSIVENTGEFIEYPEALKKALEQLNSKKGE